MRRLHGLRRRQGRRVVRAAGGSRRGQASHDPGRTLRRAAPAVGGRLRRGGSVPVRVLLAGHPDEGGGFAGQEPVSVPGRGLPGPRREPLPVHRLREDRRRRRLAAAARRGGASGGRDHGRRGFAQREVPGGRARAGRQALHQRHGTARHVARRRAVLRPPPGARVADRHVGRVGGAGRRGGRHRSRRAGADAQGDIRPDWPQFIGEGDTTRYVGDILAAVAAGTDARRGPPPSSSRSTTRSWTRSPIPSMPCGGAPLLHPEIETDDGNVLALHRVKRGDADAALAASAHVVHETFTTQFVEHAFLEPESSLAVPREDGGVQVFSQGQGVWHDRHQIASFLGVPEDRVTVTQVATAARSVPRRICRPVSRRAPGDEDRPPGSRDAVARGVPPIPREAPPAHHGVPGGMRRGRTAHRGEGEDRRRHGGVRERRRGRGAARGGPRVQRLSRGQRRRGGAGRLHEQPAVWRDARVRINQANFAMEGVSTDWRSSSGSTPGRCGGATPWRWAIGSEPARCWARGSASSGPWRRSSRSGTRRGRRDGPWAWPAA